MIGGRSVQRAAAILVSIGLAAGCGSDGGAAPAPTSFVDSMSSACRAAADAIDELDAGDSGAVSDLADYLSTMLDQIEALDPPASMTISLVGYTTAVENVITQLGRLDDAIDAGDAAAQERAVSQINALRESASASATALGLPRCADVIPEDGLAGDLIAAATTESPTTTNVVASTTAATTLPATTLPATTLAPETTLPPTTPPATAAPTTQPAVTTISPGAPIIDTVEASAVRPDGIDSCGDPTNYAPENLIDGQRDTAWMAVGDGAGERITFRFAAPAVVREVGLIPGYDKFDPCTDQDRFYELRRVTKVRWSFDDGTRLEQTLDPQSPRLQLIAVPAGTVSSMVVLTILETTGPGVPTLDHTPISEVAIT